MSKAKLMAVRLSGNPSKETVDCANGLGGKINVDSNDVAYFLIEIQEAAAPGEFIMSPARAVRTVRAKSDVNNMPVLDAAGLPIWTVSPAQFAAAKGLLLTGSFQTHNVVPYDLNSRQVGTYTTYVDGKENPVTVFARAGHPIVDAQTGELLVGQAVKAEVPEPFEA